MNRDWFGYGVRSGDGDGDLDADVHRFILTHWQAV